MKNGAKSGNEVIKAAAPCIVVYERFSSCIHIRYTYPSQIYRPLVFRVSLYMTTIGEMKAKVKSSVALLLMMALLSHHPATAVYTNYQYTEVCTYTTVTRIYLPFTPSKEARMR